VRGLKLNRKLDRPLKFDDVVPNDPLRALEYFEQELPTLTRQHASELAHMLSMMQDDTFAMAEVLSVRIHEYFADEG